MEKLDTKELRLNYITSEGKRYEERKRIKEETKERAEQLRELNKQIWEMTEAINDRANLAKCDN